MAAPNASVTEELNALTGCSICFEDCDDPRALPCMHTYCLKCLKNLAAQKSPGERLRCPLCRKKFSIPRYGVGSLPKNPIVSRIIEISNSSRTDHDKEGTERERLRKNAEKVSVMIADGVRDAKLRRKATVNFIERNKQEKEKIGRKIEALNVLLADMDSRRFRNLDVLSEENERMDQHLATLESFKDYCLSLIEKGSAAAISQEVPELDKRLQELDESHASRTLREFNVRQNLLENKDIDSSSWPNAVGSVDDIPVIESERIGTENDDNSSQSGDEYTGGSNRRRDSHDTRSDRNLSRRRHHSSEVSDRDTRGSGRKRAKLADTEARGRRESPNQSPVSDDYGTPPTPSIVSPLSSDSDALSEERYSYRASSFDSHFSLGDDTSDSDSNADSSRYTLNSALREALREIRYM